MTNLSVKESCFVFFSELLIIQEDPCNRPLLFWERFSEHQGQNLSINILFTFTILDLMARKWDALEHLLMYYQYLLPNRKHKAVQTFSNQSATYSQAGFKSLLVDFHIIQKWMRPKHVKHNSNEKCVLIVANRISKTCKTTPA